FLDVLRPRSGAPDLERGEVAAAQGRRGVAAAHEDPADGVERDGRGAPVADEAQVPVDDVRPDRERAGAAADDAEVPRDEVARERAAGRRTDLAEVPEHRGVAQARACAAD